MDTGPGPALRMEGADLRVLGDLTLPGEAVVVTFTPRRNFTETGRARSSGFGEAFLAKAGVPHVCFISKANHWWNTPELDAALEALRPRLARFARVLTYGVSMGAHGALIAAAGLGASHVLAFSPQADLSGRLPLHPTWARDMERVTIRHELATRLPAPGTRITLVLDPQVAIDRAHRRAIEALLPAETLPTPQSGHSSALFLSDLSLLKPLVSDAIAGELDLAQHRRALREARLRHPLYRMRIAGRLEAAGRPALARDWRGQAVDLLLEGARWDSGKAHLLVMTHLRELLEQGRLRQWRALVQRLEAHPDHAYSAHLARSETHVAAGAAKPAIRMARAAAALRPGQAHPHILMTEALLLAGRLTAAEKQAGQAARRSGGFPRDWARLAQALRGAGCAEAAARAQARAGTAGPAPGPG